jgi:two-component system response regulator FixJ
MHQGAVGGDPGWNGFPPSWFARPMPIVARPTPMVVLLDDDAALRQALTFLLEIEGYQVLACETGEQLMTQALPERDACLVLDYRLETGTGLDVLEALRARGVALPAILITSPPKPDVHARVERLKAILVEKPLLGDLLLARIHDVLALQAP